MGAQRELRMCVCVHVHAWFLTETKLLGEKIRAQPPFDEEIPFHLRENVPFFAVEKEK